MTEKIRTLRLSEILLDLNKKKKKFNNIAPELHFTGP